MGTPLPFRTIPGLNGIGILNQPTVGRIDVTGLVHDEKTNTYRLDLAFVGARIPVTDATTSGSYGTLKILDFVQQAISFLGSRIDFTKFREGAALTTAAGDAAFEIGVGTSAIAAAADGTLGDGANENVAAAVAVTLSSGTGTGTGVTGSTAVVNGTASASSLNLNVSGTAATIDASSTLDVWGTFSVSFAFLGDD